MYIFVHLIKPDGLTLVGDMRRYINDCYYYYCYSFGSIGYPLIIRL